MNSEELENNSRNRRQEFRTKIPELEAAVRKQSLLPGKDFTVCQTVDIDRGGIAVISSTLTLQIGDKVTLRLHYDERQYIINGIISYHHPHDTVNQYGIIFIHVPYEFDTLLDTLLEDNEQGVAPAIPPSNGNNKMPGLKLVKGTQRRIETRSYVPDLAIRVARKTHLNKSAFVSCNLIDIGRGGAGFITDSFDQPLASRIELELRYQHHHYQLSSLVSFYQPSTKGYRYGVEFLSVPPKLTRLIDELLCK